MNGLITIITGGANGIGLATVKRFCRKGATVIIWDIDCKNGESVASDLVEQGFKADFICVNTTKLPEVTSAAREVQKKYGRIDILINIAGITRDAMQMDMQEDRWQQIVDLNLAGVHNCTKAVSPYMAQNRFGRIINTSSLVGIYCTMGQERYAAAKAGLTGVTKVWARELSKHGITVNAVAPGFIELESGTTLPDNILQTIKNKIPVGRLGSVEDIANAYVFLASRSASYVNGSVLNVDGGYVP